MERVIDRKIRHIRSLLEDYVPAHVWDALSRGAEIERIVREQRKDDADCEGRVIEPADPCDLLDRAALAEDAMIGFVRSGAFLDARTERNLFIGLMAEEQEKSEAPAFDATTEELLWA